MIAQLDIFSNIASFLDFADNLVLSIPDAYRLPAQSLQNMGVMTHKMLIDHPELAETCLHPDIIAEAIVLGDAGIPSYVINHVIKNPRLDADISLAVRFINLIMFEVDSDGFDDDEAMKRICRYDSVMYHYNAYMPGYLDNIQEYFYGRSIYEMFRLISESPGQVYRLAETCSTIESLESFLDELKKNDYDYQLTFLVNGTEMSHADHSRLCDKYYIFSSEMDE